MLLRGNFPPKINSYVNSLWRNYLSYVFEFQLVPFAFIVTLRDPFMVSPPPKKYDEWWGGGGLFYKKCFSRGTNFVGKIIGGLFYVGELMIRSYQGRRSFKNYVFQ